MSTPQPASIVAADALRAAVGYADLVEPVSRAFQASSAGRAQNGLVVMFPEAQPERGDVYVKTGAVAGSPVFIVKVSPWFAVNVERGDPQGGFLAVFDAASGRTRAILDEQHYLSDIRTAAAGALAARLFAPPTVATATVLGSGVQAYWQARALYGERPFERLLIWARSGEKAWALAARLRLDLPRADIAVAPEIEPAVRAADVLVTATLAKEPLVRGEWLRPGQHVTAVGADDATKCELDAAVLRRARVFVDDRATALANGDVHRAVQEGLYDADEIAGEIGEVLSGHIQGRQSPEEITVAKFVGLGAQDLAAAEAALHKLSLWARPTPTVARRR